MSDSKELFRKKNTELQMHDFKVTKKKKDKPTPKLKHLLMNSVM
jgi:hypothetical protein